MEENGRGKGKGNQVGFGRVERSQGRGVGVDENRPSQYIGAGGGRKLVRIPGMRGNLENILLCWDFRFFLCFQKFF